MSVSIYTKKHIFSNSNISKKYSLWKSELVFAAQVTHILPLLKELLRDTHTTIFPFLRNFTVLKQYSSKLSSGINEDLRIGNIDIQSL